VTPRFAMSTTDAMLEMCQSLVREHEDVRVTSHINEQPEEIAAVRAAFPWARDYLAVYERFGLAGARSVLAHNVHAAHAEIERLAAARASIAHCPCSNAALGSGIFPLRAHVDAGVRVALGTDVGGGTGFSMMKEALQAHMLQRLVADGVVLDAARMLYLSTLAGAEALGLAETTGSFCTGKAADFVYLRPPAGSVVDRALRNAVDAEDALDALFTLADASTIRETRVEGTIVYQA
jgi:guanine deaminase